MDRMKEAMIKARNADREAQAREAVQMAGLAVDRALTALVSLEGTGRHVAEARIEALRIVQMILDGRAK